MGKKSGKDVKVGKATYPKVYGLAKAKENAMSLCSRRRRYKFFYGPKAEFLKKDLYLYCNS